MKKVLIIIGLIVLVLLVVCLVVGIITTTRPNDFEYSIDYSTNTVTITGLAASKSYKAHIDIPEKIKGYPVTSISEYAFKGNEEILTLELPKTISYIGKGAFENCKNLKSVSGLEKCSELKTIEDNVFRGCYRLKKIKLPNNITSIGSAAFEFCRDLKELSIPNSVSYIGERAFSNCQSIKEFKIPQEVTKIEDETFLGCYAMESITLSQGTTHIGIEAFDACSKLKGVVIPASVTKIEAAAFVRCYSLLSIDVNSDNSAYISVDGVLYNKDLTELVAYPAGKTDKTFSIPQGVTAIAKGAFTYNQNLETLNLPKSVNYISNLFLYETLIKTINYEGSVSDWEKIVTDSTLDAGSLFETINCTDGQIAKDGTVTYK